MNATRKEKPLAGSRQNPQAGTQFSPPLANGETPEMTLAILNSVLETMVANGQARIMGKVILKGGQAGTMILFEGYSPAAANKLQADK